MIALLARLISPLTPHAAPFLDILRRVFVDHVDGWVTAAATATIAWFTFTLSKETRRQAEKDRPFLAIGLRQDDNPSAAPDSSYWQMWTEADRADSRLAQYQKTASPFYVRIRVTNEQSTAIGIAAEVKMQATLFFGVNDNVTAYPYKLEREIVIPVLGANKYVEGPVFNVAGLDNYSIVLAEVTYSDISGKKRRAAHGIGQVYKPVGRELIYTIKVFQPGKGEVTR